MSHYHGCYLYFWLDFSQNKHRHIQLALSCYLVIALVAVTRGLLSYSYHLSAVSILLTMAHMKILYRNRLATDKWLQVDIHRYPIFNTIIDLLHSNIL
jgi:hypothetical protein